MENTQKKSIPNKPKSNLFLGCFRWYNQPVIEEIREHWQMVNVTNNNIDKKQKKTMWYFSWSKLHLKNTARTVSVDSPRTSGKLSGGKKAPVVKSELAKRKEVDSYIGCRKIKKSSYLKGKTPVSNQKLPCQIPALEVPPVGVAKEKPHVQTRYGSEQSIILGNGKQLDHVEAHKDATLQRQQSFSRKIDAIRTGSNLPDPTKPKPKNQTVQRLISMPIHGPAIKSGVTAIAKGYDPMVGMSIVIVTLLIMILWGKICAILCTCIWLYFVPRLRTIVDEDGTAKASSGSVEPDFDSEEYKKRVILEGFLGRSHRLRV